MTCMATLLLKEGTLSQSFCSSFMAAGDKMSGLMDSACPSCKHITSCDSKTQVPSGRCGVPY